MAALAHPPSAMEKFIDKFLELDSNHDGVVQKKELQAACKKGGMTKKEVEEWLKHFDINRDGNITLTEFCHVLGLKEDEMMKERQERKDQRDGVAPQLNPDVKVIATTMSLEKQADVSNEFIRLIDETKGDQEKVKHVAQQMKDFLDKKYSRAWQTIVILGSYWMKFSHGPLMSMQFQYDKYICVLWRTMSE